MYDPKKAHYISATCIVIKNGKFLIAKRSENEKSFPGKWTIPGGKMETSDYMNRQKDTTEHWYNVLENAARREVMEETGIGIKNIRYLTSMAFIRHDGIPMLVVSLYADYAGGDVALSPDMSDYDWISLEEAKNYDLIEGIYEELFMLDGILKHGHSEEWEKN